MSMSGPVYIVLILLEERLTLKDGADEFSILKYKYP